MQKRKEKIITLYKKIIKFIYTRQNSHSKEVKKVCLAKYMQKLYE